MAIDELKLIDDIWKYALTCKNTSFEFARRMSDIEKIIDAQPKLSLENKTSDKWIPVTERLPEEKASEFSPHYTSSDVVLVSVYSKRYGYEIFKNFLLDGKWSCERQMSEYKVLVWMPLPEAYKEE